MDFETVGWLLPWVGGALIVVMAVRRDAQMWIVVAVALFAFWGFAWGISDVSCVLEGFADGPLPIECRPAAAPHHDFNLGTGHVEPRPAPLAARRERTPHHAAVKPLPRLEAQPQRQVEVELPRTALDLDLRSTVNLNERSRVASMPHRQVHP